MGHSNNDVFANMQASVCLAINVWLCHQFKAKGCNLELRTHWFDDEGDGDASYKCILKQNYVKTVHIVYITTNKLK